MNKKKIACIGNRSKVLKGLKQTVFFEGSIVDEYSISNGDYKLRKQYDEIIYFSGYSKTTCKEITEKYVAVNCMSLAHFLINNLTSINEHNIKFIYISSVKCNHIKYNFEIKKYAQEVVNCVITNTKDMNRLFNNFKSLIECPYDIYGVSKLVAEEIIALLCKNYFILRCDYIIGVEEKDNIIYSEIQKIFNEENIMIPVKTRGFITYKDLCFFMRAIQLCDSCLFGRKTYNIYGKYSLGFEEIKKMYNLYSHIIRSNSEICGIEKGYECIGESEDIIFLYKKTMGTQYSYVDVYDEMKNIFYRQYIENVLKGTIVTELYGGSYAKVYKIKMNNSYLSIKMALGDGADNGNKKLAMEVQQLNAVNEYFQKYNIKTILLPSNINEFYSANSFSYIVSEWNEGEILFDKIVRNEKSDNYIECIVNEITKCYKMKRRLYEKDIIDINVKRAHYRLSKICDMAPEIGKLINFESVEINNEYFMSPQIILNSISKSWGEFKEEWGICISGDAIFDNIIINTNGHYKIFDPRGRDLIWEIDNLPYFYPSYDYAKMLFYFWGWKIIRLELYNCDGKDNKWTIKYDGSDSIIKELIAHGEKTYSYIESIIKTRNDNAYLKNVLLLSGIHFLCDAYPRLCGKGNTRKQCIGELLLGTLIINEILLNKDKSAGELCRIIIKKLHGLIQNI